MPCYLGNENKREVPLAAFKISLPETSNVDDENGIVRGCQLAKIGKLARFADKNGNAKEILVTPELVGDLLELGKTAGQVQAHWTHDRFNPENAGRDHAHDGVGFWSDFRTDESGNLIADANLEAGNPYRDRIMWRAKKDPRGLMASLVFDYSGGTNDARAKSLYSGDFVKTGAATVALLSAFTQPTQKQMDDETKQAITEAAKLAVADALKDHNTQIATLSAAASKAGTITPEQELAILSKAKIELESTIEARFAEATKLAEANVIKHLGANPALRDFTGANGANKHAFLAKVEANEAAGAKREIAILRAQNDNPELFNDYQKTRGIFKQ